MRAASNVLCKYTYLFYVQLRIYLLAYRITKNFGIESNCADKTGTCVFVLLLTAFSYKYADFYLVSLKIVRLNLAALCLIMIPV